MVPSALAVSNNAACTLAYTAVMAAVCATRTRVRTRTARPGPVLRTRTASTRPEACPRNNGQDAVTDDDDTFVI